jgi:hypothetical protein
MKEVVSFFQIIEAKHFWQTLKKFNYVSLGAVHEFFAQGCQMTNLISANDSAHIQPFWQIITHY